MSHVLLFVALLALTTVYAVWRGGAPERIGAAILLVGVIATPIAASASHVRWQQVEVGVMLTDGAALAAFLVLMIWANRLWPIAMTSLLILQLAGHLLKLLDPTLYPFLYWVTATVWGYLMLAVLASGTWLHRRRLRSHGYDNAWSKSWHRTPPSDPGS
ncbi:hypothetical protein [Sphingomonas hengshuiensis]|uniref:hypothetical protein n=1 Tax=Sphingomonas hengshuiensis TaxID=1609977 RepID=UPI0006962042|nr:hypothetical protein [Sphingomonas hengshuiensis]